MAAWINTFLSVGVVLIMSSLYLMDGALVLMASLLLLFVFVIFIRERTRWAIVYLNVLINLLYLWLAIWMMNGEISFLTDESFIFYYKKSLLLETIFWATFTVLYGFFVPIDQRSAIFDLRVKMNYPVEFQFYIVIALFIFEIMLSSGAYFKSYSEFSDTGTIAYEIGCLLLALAIVTRTDFSSKHRSFVLETLAVGLALFIVIGSGKRLPFAYVIMAYLIFSLLHYGKLHTVLIYLVISGFGFFFGIFRDFMTSDGLEAELLASGFGSSNQGAVLHASAVYLRVADEGLSTVIDRGVSFLSNFFGALLLPISYLPEQAQINVHAMKYYDVQGNGGFIGPYSYFFLDWMGPFFLASVLACLCAHRGRWLNLLVMILVVTSPRWTLYNIGPVLRMISMTFMVVVFCYFVFNLIIDGLRRR